MVEAALDRAADALRLGGEVEALLDLVGEQVSQRRKLRGEVGRERVGGEVSAAVVARIEDLERDVRRRSRRGACLDACHDLAQLTASTVRVITAATVDDVFA